MKQGIESQAKLINIVQTSGWIVLAILWILTIFIFFNIPNIVPIHFNHSGVPDDYGNKSTIFILALIGTVLFWVLSFLHKAIKSAFTMTLFPLLQLIIVIFFTIFIVVFGFAARGIHMQFENWLLPVTVVLFCLPTIWFVVQVVFYKSSAK